MLPRRAIAEMFARSFLLQASFNLERMQNLGFAFVLTPALRRLYPDPARRAAAIRRHLEYFNTHPFLAPILVGIAANLEEAAAAGESEAGGAGGFKARLMGTYGAIGDSLFWGALQPAAALAALILAALSPLAGAIFFLAVFNIPRLALVWWGLAGGYRQGPAFHERVRQLHLPSWTRRLGIALSILAGFSIGFWWVAAAAPEERLLEMSLGAAAGAATYGALRSGISRHWCLYGGVAIVIGLSLALGLG